MILQRTNTPRPDVGAVGAGKTRGGNIVVEAVPAYGRRRIAPNSRCINNSVVLQVMKRLQPVSFISSLRVLGAFL